MAARLIHESLPVGMLQCNCHVLGDAETGEALVIDPGDEVARIEEILARHRLKVRAIVSTHAHIDHVGGLAHLAQSTGAPVLMFMAIYAGIFAVHFLSQNAEYWDLFWRLVPGALTCLVALKFLLAFLAFRVCLKRGLLAPSSMLAYLAGWTLMVVALVISTAILFHDKPWLFTMCMVIILLTPLARISFAPITLAWNRHE